MALTNLFSMQERIAAIASIAMPLDATSVAGLWIGRQGEPRGATKCQKHPSRSTTSQHSAPLNRGNSFVGPSGLLFYVRGPTLVMASASALVFWFLGSPARPPCERVWWWWVCSVCCDVCRGRACAVRAVASVGPLCFVNELMCAKPTSRAARVTTP